MERKAENIMGVSITPHGNHEALCVTPFMGAKAAKLQRRTEFEVFRHGLQAAATSMCDQQDGQATADAIRASLDEELDLLEWGLHRANGSAAKTELVARKVNQLACINDNRLNRNFGR
jgi:hypothetical protein